MLEDIKHIKISKDVSSKDDLDFDFLRKKGIEYIESMGGGLWSDMNVHDPGITYLETIAYAITDLGNRMNLPIENLIASEDDLDLKRQFNQAHEILPIKATNALDYRKLFSDIPGVRNSWIYPYLRKVFADTKNSEIAYSEVTLGNPTPGNKQTFNVKGLNAVLVDYDLNAEDPDGNKVTQEWINEQIKAAYYKNRNLCEDLVRIDAVKEHPIGVCASIELEKTADEDLVHAKVLNAIEDYFAPEIQHHSLKEMIDRGYRTDQIFEGPFLEKGFVDPNELAEADLRSEVRLSDLVKLIMEVEGVKLISDLTIKDCQGNKDGSKWLIQIAPYTRPKLCSTKKSESDACCTVSSFNYVKDVLPITYSETRVKEHQEAILEEKRAYVELSKLNRKLSVKRGVFMNSGETTTLQNELPETYGISQFGLPPNASEARKSQALQLKGYLSFFDQILASYFSHLSKVKDLLSISTGVVPTYFTQAIEDVRGLDKLMVDYPTDDDELLAKKLMDDLDNNIERRNAILDHLLARFAENFSEYTFLMRELYGQVSDEMVLYSKEQFLKEYVEFSTARGTGYNVCGKVWDTDNVSGTQKRIARLTGIRNYNRRNLSRSLVEIYVADGSTTGKFLWQVRNHFGERILNSGVSFNTTSIASNEVYLAIRTLVNVDIEEVEKAFEEGVSHGDQIDNIVIYQRPDGQFKFNVVDPTRLNSKGEFEIIGIFAGWDETIEELRDHLIGIIKFLKHDFDEEGLFLIEHIFLLPNVTKNDAEKDEFLPVCIEDRQDCCSMDPYSFKVSVVLPGYTQRFSDPDFRNYMELLIQSELPAHVVPRICWIGHRDTFEIDKEAGEQNQLMLLEKAYMDYLEELKIFKGCTGTQEPIKKATFLALKDILFDLDTLYPSGRLHDCESEEDLEGKIILGRTNLGTL